MRYGVPVSNGVLDAHFGHCAGFALIDTDEQAKSVTNMEIIPSPGHVPGVLPGWLAGQGASIVIVGGMGGRAIDLFKENGIEVIIGAPSIDPEAVVLEYMNGNLISSGNACEDHSHGC
ncbi:MAG: NifB/NifX family molybdenum-iron cluster-binding protein [Chloroflexota bacterium]|nr:NifB/NifX family molybdenum-iron cluster-binding protein [Chloroflexota bacterium]